MSDSAALATHRRQLVGRQRELIAVEAALRRHAGGAAVTLWFQGEAGIGKTRLLEEIRRRAEARGNLVLVGRGAEFELDVPFGVWIDALDDCAASLGGDGLRRLVDDRVHELSWILPSVSAAPGTAVPRLPEERYRAHRAVRALLDAMAGRRPVLVSLDDLHWADAASIELTVHLLRRPCRAPVLMVLAFRSGRVPVELVAALESATRETHAVAVSLAPLSRAEAEPLLADLPPDVRPETFRQSGGNPFYLEELVRARRAHRPTPAPTGRPAEIPQAVAAALGQEIAALGPAARRLAQGAAIVGDPVDLDLSLAAADLGEPEAMEALDELLVADLLRPTEVARRYHFRHPIVRRAIYEAAGESWRLAGHARAAAALEARDASLTDRAHHLERCARPGDERAIAVLSQAAHEVGHRAPASAARWLEAALRLLPATDAAASRRAELRVPLAIAQAASGHLERALDTLQDVLAHLPTPAVDLRSRLVAACAAAENLLGRHAEAHARLLRELSDLSELSPAAAGVLQVELAVDAIYDADFDAVRAWAGQALDAALTSGDAALAALAAALECFAHYSAGDMEPAERSRAAAAERLDALSVEQLAGRLEAPYYLGFAEFFCERYDDAARHLRRGIAAARATGQGQYLVPMVILLAHALETRGHLQEGVELAEAAADAARLSANSQILAWALAAVAWTSVVSGDHKRSAAAAREADGLLQGVDTTIMTAGIHTTLGAAWLEARDVDRGLAQLVVGGSPEFPLVERGRRAWLYAKLALAELARGNPDVAEGWLARGDATLGGLDLPMAESTLLQARAHLELARGAPPRALDLALRAVQRATTVGAHVQAARCRTTAGRACVAMEQRERAEEELRAAEADLGACGAERLRSEAVRELRCLGHKVGGRQRRARGRAGVEALSGREREIAELVARGRTNRQIGDELFLAAKTVEGHLTTIFAKLGVTTRAEVAEAVGRARYDD